MAISYESTKPSVYLIDASIYIFRAWFSIPDAMIGENGSPINAVYGFAKFLAEFSELSKASHIAVTFDESLTSSFRNELYPAYKMNRELPPEALVKQFKLCRRVAEAAGFYCVGSEQFEADDLVATLALSMREQGYRNVIVTADKDLAQLIEGDDYWWNFAKGERLNADQVEDKFGVPPTAIQDYLGLCGDVVDNIPGVPGIGPKTASALLKEYKSLENIYQNLDAIQYLAIRGAKGLASKLRQHQAQAELSKLLATVSYEAHIKKDAQDLARRSAEVALFQDIRKIMGGHGDSSFRRLIESSRRQQAEVN